MVRNLYIQDLVMMSFFLNCFTKERISFGPIGGTTARFSFNDFNLHEFLNLENVSHGHGTDGKINLLVGVPQSERTGIVLETIWETDETTTQFDAEIF